MRTHSAGERALLGARYDLFLRVEAANANGTMIDLSTWCETVDVEADLDNGASRCTIALARESGSGGTQSLAPFMGASVLNRDNAAAYAPLLHPNRTVRVSTAVCLPGVGPGVGDWRVLFNGYTDDVQSGASPVTVSCRDNVKPLLDTHIEVPRSYGAVAPGVDAATVMQSIINDNVANPPALVLGPQGSPSWSLLTYLQDTVRVYEAIRALALQIGWDVRMRWSGATELLTLYQPARTKTVADFSLGPNEYVALPSLSINDDTIRNYVEVSYTDAITGIVSTVAAFDPASITAFGRRYMRIAESASSNIDSSAEAQAMADAALADLAFPRAAQEVEATYFWPVELGDLVSFAPNGVHYDSTQLLAVASFRHHLEHGSGTTTLRTSGKPAGAYAAWIAMSRPDPSGLLPGVPEFLDLAPPQELTASGIIVGWRLAGRVDLDTQAVIVSKSASLSIVTTTPTAVQVVNGAVTEYWLDVVPGGFFTIDTLLVQGGAGTVNLTPASIYNPLAVVPPPRGGTLGLTVVRVLSRAPETSITWTEPTITTRGVTLSTRPSTAIIHYRFAPVPIPAAAPWVIAPTPGTVSFLLDISAATIGLEYFAVSVDGVSEEIHLIRFDQNDLPVLDISVVESTPNVVTVTLAPDDDVVRWELYVKRGGIPTVTGAYPWDMDPAYLKYSGNRDKTQVAFAAGGNGVPGVDTWWFVALCFDKLGRRGADPSGFGLLVRGTSGPNTVGGISGASAVLSVEGPTTFIDVVWLNNSVVEAASSARFSVKVYENAVLVATQPAKTDHLGTDSIAAKGGWHRPCNPSSVGVGSYFTFDYDLELYDTGALVGRAAAQLQGWFLSAGFGSPPSGTPPVAVVSFAPPPSAAFDRLATWSTAATELELEWQSSTDNFATFSIVTNVILTPSTSDHILTGMLPGRSARTRSRYINGYGAGAWGAYSNVV